MPWYPKPSASTLNDPKPSITVPGDVDLNSRQCKHDGCRKQPTFGDASVGRMVYCKLHKKPHHVDVRRRAKRKSLAKSVEKDRQGVAAESPTTVVPRVGAAVDPDIVLDGSAMDHKETVLYPGASTPT